jgi:Domain of unknown function (DUF222)
MEVLDPISLIAGLTRVEIHSAAQPEIIHALENIRRVRARVDASEVALARRLHELTPLADSGVAKAAQRPNRHGDRVRKRAETTTAIPALADAFDTGEISGEHVDAISKAVTAAPEEIRNELREAITELVPDIVQSGLTPDDIAKRLADKTKQLEADDGIARLERQRRATRLRTWTDKHDGMFHISGTFDSYSGVAIQGRLQAAMAAMFANGIPNLAPTDPAERQDFLRALAFIALTAGIPNTKPTSRETANSDDVEPDLTWAPFATTGPPRFGRPEVIVVVDCTHLDENGQPTVDWGGPISLPFHCLEDLSKHADVYQVSVNNGNIAGSPWSENELNLGRTTRLANRAQRRSLQVLYSTCAVPGCCVKYEFTKPHHIKFWRNGGPTDLINLLPLCSHHHDRAHNGWIFQLGPNRELTITLSNGQTMKTGPPNRNDPP